MPDEAAGEAAYGAARDRSDGHGVTTLIGLPASPDAPGRARSALRELCGADHPQLCDDAALLVTELVSNAVRHAGTPVTVRATLLGGLLRLEVEDGSTRPVRDKADDLMAENGRGLLLVDALADRWGVEAHPHGKQVWAELNEASR